MANKKIVPVEQARKEGKPMAADNKDFTKIIISDKEGTKYTLEFNARVVKTMERKGFKIDTDFPNTMIDELFLGAFQMHHRNIMPDRVRDIWMQQSHKDDLLGVLTKLYLKPIEELMAEPEGEEGDSNPTWETV